MKIKIQLDDLTYRKFEVAKMITGDDEQDLILNFIKDYTRRVLADDSAKGISSENKKETNANKALSRIPLWARRKDQYNYKILQAFFLDEIDGKANRQEMKTIFCKNASATAWQFDNNFASMCTNEGNSHGKVFACSSETVMLEPEIEELARSLREEFLAGVELHNDGGIIIDKRKISNSARQKSQFVAWFKTLRYKGNPYNPVTISGYTGRIESACIEPEFVSIEPKNLFEITDLEEFKNIKRKIMSCSGYAVFDAKSHKGFTAALNKYEQFLEYLNNH